MFIDVKNPENFTLENVRLLVASTDDSQDRQFRITTDGYLFISDLIGNLGLEGILCRYETMIAGNGYLGQKAAQDEEYIDRLYRSFKKNWPTPVSEYIDSF